MKPRNFGGLAGASAASANSGTIGVRKDKITHVDPTTEILYDPAENVRNHKFVDDGIEGLIELRLAMDASEQLQPIRLYPLPPEKLDPSKPNLKYGIGYGHRRMLSCRLTSKDHPAIGDKPRKVEAIIDVEWKTRPPSYRRRCQIQENTLRLDLNPVELGLAIQEYQRDLAKEEKRHIPQHELMETFGLREKTVWALLKAAEFDEITQRVCHQNLLSDLDTMVTFDAICKLNKSLGQAIYDSLRVEGAPNNRGYIRAAKVMADDPNYVFDPDTWVWPDTVASYGAKPVAAQQVAPALEPVQTPAATAPVGTATAEDEGAGAPPDAGREGSAGSNVVSLPANKQQSPADEPPATPPTSTGSLPPQSLPPAATPPKQSPALEPAQTPSPALKGPIIMVQFKMGAEASKTFTGELVLNEKARATSSAVIAYLDETGCEAQIEVPLKLIELVSINH